MNDKTIWRRIGVAFAGAALWTLPAHAADLGGASYRESTPDTASFWSGAYVGGHLGAAWTSGSADLATAYWHTDQGNANLTFDGYRSGHKDLGETSLLGGVHAGYNWRQGSLVYGLEGDVSFASSLDYLASGRGRLGFAAGNWLFYGTGGVAFAGTNVSGTITDQYRAVESYNVSGNQVGFVAGGGAEVKLNPKWSVGVEGLYYGFDSSSQDRSGLTPAPSQNNYYRYGMHAESGGDIGVVRGRVCPIIWADPATIRLSKCVSTDTPVARRP